VLFGVIKDNAVLVDKVQYSNLSLLWGHNIDAELRGPTPALHHTNKTVLFDQDAEIKPTHTKAGFLTVYSGDLRNWRTASIIQVSSSLLDAIFSASPRSSLDAEAAEFARSMSDPFLLNLIFMMKSGHFGLLLAE
jgi:hypothetical protein